MAVLASLAIAFAGILHAFLAPSHYAHTPAHGLFFLMAGVSEITWAYLFWRKPDEKTYYAGLMISGGLVVLWAASFAKRAKCWGWAHCWCWPAKARSFGIAKRSLGRLFAEAVLLSFFMASLTYVAGHDLEPMWPFLAGEEHRKQTE